MRAEAQAHADQINAALALLRRFLDWDRALKRLDELNAKVEDSSLWDDPKAAQEVMRERRRLEEAINATRSIERELADTKELLELAETEGDQALGQPQGAPGPGGGHGRQAFGEDAAEAAAIGAEKLPYAEL